MQHLPETYFILLDNTDALRITMPGGSNLFFTNHYTGNIAVSTTIFMKLWVDMDEFSILST